MFDDDGDEYGNLADDAAFIDSADMVPIAIGVFVGVLIGFVCGMLFLG